MTLLSRQDPSTMMRYGATLSWEEHVSVSRHFSALLTDLLEPHPMNRPQNAREVLERVARIRVGAMPATFYPPPDLCAGLELELGDCNDAAVMAFSRPPANNHRQIVRRPRVWGERCRIFRQNSSS